MKNSKPKHGGGFLSEALIQSRVVSKTEIDASTSRQRKSRAQNGERHNPRRFQIKEQVWRYPGAAGWFFVRVGKADASKIRFIEESQKVGWGYICIQAKVGKTTWSTTLFPTKEKDFLIALKAAVRKAEKIEAGDIIKVSFTLTIPPGIRIQRPSRNKDTNQSE